jgi:DNA-binding XRE family transcriptional regulator
MNYPGHTVSAHRNEDSKILSDPHRLLKAAQSHLEAGECDFAVVRALAASESAIRQRLQLELGGKSKTAEKLVPDLLEPQFSKSFSAATGLDIQSESFWDSLCKSVRKRNAIVHQGERAGAVEARQTLKAAKALVAFVERTADETIASTPSKCDTTIEFSQILKSLLESRGMTQKELARRSKLSEQAISRLLCGKHSPTLTTVSRIASVFGCKADIRMIDQSPQLK